MAKKCPCQNCTENRYVGCHSKCEIYLEWQQEFRKERTAYYLDKNSKGISLSARCKNYRSKFTKGKNTIR